MVLTRAGSRAASEALETPTREAVAAPASLPAARSEITVETPTKSRRIPRKSLKSFTPSLDSPREKAEVNGAGEKTEDAEPSPKRQRKEKTKPVRPVVPPTPSGGGASSRRRQRQKDRIRALKACPDIAEEGEEEGMREVLDKLLDEGSVCLSRVARAVGGDDWEKKIPVVRGVVLAGVREGRYVVDGNGTRVSWVCECIALSWRD